VQKHGRACQLGPCSKSSGVSGLDTSCLKPTNGHSWYLDAVAAAGDRLELETFEQRGEGNFQGVSDSREVPYRRVPHALLDPPHIGAVHPSLIGQELLRPSLRLPELSNPLAERLLDGIYAFRHVTC
jgi:hypothetical protein